MNNTKNLILSGDSYKYCHHLQTPEKTETIYSYVEARGCKNPNIRKTLFLGLQPYIKDYLLTPITKEMVDEAKEIIEMHGLPFNYDGWMHIVNEHDGKLPIVIEAVPEGSVVELSNVLVQIHNTDSKVPWLTSFIETSLLRAIWYMTTVGTNSWYIKRNLIAYAELTESDVEGIPFKLHDFGARGVSSGESAMLGGMAHLVNFMGTDTIEAIVGAKKYYGCDMAGFSIPASEHSTMTIWGEKNEIKAYENMLKQFAKPKSLVAIVSDSYDIDYAVNEIWGHNLKQQVIDSGATIVVRPDSGDPTTVPVKVIMDLMKHYGYTTNERGYKTLPDCIRVIQGDGINAESINDILHNMEWNKLSLDNIAFGMGGALLQDVTRDGIQFAMKASHAIIDGVGRDIYKNPKGDAGKKSKRGILVLDKSSGKYETRQLNQEELVWDHFYNELRKVYENGELLIDDSFEDIRKRASI